MGVSFDVFLSYNRGDASVVRELAHKLKGHGIEAWLADDQIRPGVPWQEAVEGGIETARAAAVLVGRDGIGPWGQQEMRALLSQFVNRGLPVIPVLLPLAPKQPELPLFLKVFTWVDLRSGLSTEGVAQLAWGITGDNAANPRSPTSGADHRPKISISHLPSPGKYFVSREAELKRMDRAWEDRHVNVLSIIAAGGVGKSALVNRWLTRITPAYRGAERVFCWSFYREVASVDRFLAEALRWFGNSEPPAGSAWDRGCRLADLVRQRRTILVLDGLEVQQHPPGATLDGRLKDLALKVLIKELAAFNRGLCIVTTRQPVFEISHYMASSAPQIDLPGLKEEAGARLLKELGVVGEEPELRQAANSFHGHALALSLLGRYLRQAYNGRIHYRDHVELLEADQRFGGQAEQVMKAYEAWLGPQELAILRLIAFFDRPIEKPTLDALLAEPVIPGLAEELVSMHTRDWRLANENLRNCGLLLQPRGSRNEMTLDAPPLVRAYFRRQLQKHETAWTAGNLRLYRHFQHSAPELPATLEEMIPLYRAVVHGCRAGEHRDALSEVYYQRIMRRDEHFSWKSLGCLGTELATLASFFDNLWDRPSENLRRSEQGFVLSAAGMCMRILGHLREAAEPMRASLELAKELKNWDEAAFRSNNLCDLHLIRGELDQALARIEESIDLADRGTEDFLKAGTRLTHAHVLHQTGNWQASLEAFKASEKITHAKKRLRQDALLYLHGAFPYCEYLLGKAEAVIWPLATVTDPESSRSRCQQAKECAEQALEAAEDKGWDREIALSHMFLGRACLDLELLATHGEDQTGAGTARFETAARHLNQAVDRLRRSEQRTYVPRALLARAALYRAIKDDRVFADLTEAQKLAGSQGLPLHECDVHLEWARLHAERRELALARERIDLAKELAFAKGYRCRNQEIAAVEKVVPPSG